MSEKNRHLPILEYYEKLQLEYFACEIRSKIYPTTKDKKYYKRVMGFKQKKIEDIATRNNIPSIFNNEEVRSSYIRKAYPDCGLPKIEMSTQDIVYYYYPDAVVRVDTGKGMAFGVIAKIELEKNVVFIKIRGEHDIKPFAAQYVTRIL